MPFTIAPVGAQGASEPFSGDLVGAFAFGPCPAGTPTGAQCMHDQVSGQISHVGPVTGEFDVVIDALATGPDGCAPATKLGAFVGASGERLEMSAAGRFCFATMATEYTYSISGRSGRLAGATGTGVWSVPAPREFDGQAGEGDEYLRGAISLRDERTFRRGKLRIGKLSWPAEPAEKKFLRVPLYSNRAGLHDVVLVVRLGSLRGPVIARTKDVGVRRRRTIGLDLSEPLKDGGRYVAEARGRDRAGSFVRARRAFRIP